MDLTGLHVVVGPGTCRHCGSIFDWVRVPSPSQKRRSRVLPFETGSKNPHRCAPGRADHEAKRGARTFAAGPVQVGERYVPSCGECSIPPWEVCACSALLSIEVAA